MIQFLIRLLVILSITKIISLMLLWFLPNKTIELKAKDNYNPTYQRVDFKNMLGQSSMKEEKQPTLSCNGIMITNMILKGLFGTKTNGYAIIALKEKPENTSLVSVGESFKGYKLIKIFKDYVVLLKNQKQYILKIHTMKISKKSVSFIQNNDKINNVAKSDINYYINNPKQIWKDISISAINNPKGYKVTRVKKGSKMDNLGLKKGDIIIKANNIELKSLKDVMKIYKNIKNTTAMEIVVIRDNTEVELMYEID